MNIRKNLLTEGMVKNWNRLLGDVVESQFPGGSKEICGHGMKGHSLVMMFGWSG